jgi:polyisoprenoid-binding protein YceI
MKLFEIMLVALGCAATAAPMSAVPLEIDPQQSKIEVAVSCTMDSFVGHLEKFRTTIECNASEPLPAKAEVHFDFGDLKTGDKDRDLAMLKWLGYETNPTASFRLTTWTQTGSTNIAQGQLIIHGVTAVVQIPVAITRDQNAWDISGQAVVDCRDFKLPKIRKALVLSVNPKLKVKFRLVGKTVAPQ